MTKKLFVGILLFTFVLIGCGGVGLIVSPTSTPVPTPIPSLTPFPTVTSIAFPTNTVTLTPSATPLPTLTFTSTVTLEPQWIVQGPGQVIVPILLYHHIGVSLQGDTTYYVAPDAFERQMNLLYQWGYKTISVELLVRAITQGAQLPPKPIVLTFDDGSETTYTTALPIMQKYGFTGVSYIVYNYIGIPAYMSADQIRGLYAAGWEIGSHGLSHADLTSHPGRQEAEIVSSRKWLQSLLDIPITSFAYPFGAYNNDSLNNIHSAGYIAAMGLGKDSLQENKNLFYLDRQPVNGTDDMKAFALLLPWREDLENLPAPTALTIVP